MREEVLSIQYSVLSIQLSNQQSTFGNQRPAEPTAGSQEATAEGRLPG
jgi:hypothetical protein